MNKDKMVMVTWIDSIRNSSWSKREDHISMVASECTSVGFLLNSDEDKVTIYQSIDPETNSIGMSLTIPRIAVKEIIELRKK